jgi:hypothetical protein
MERDDVAAPALSKAEERLPEPQQQSPARVHHHPTPPHIPPLVNIKRERERENKK